MSSQHEPATPPTEQNSVRHLATELRTRYLSFFHRTERASLRDDVERILEELISSDDVTNKKAKGHFRSLFQNYDFYRRRTPSKIDPIHGNDQILSFDRMVVHWIFRAPTSRTVSSAQVQAPPERTHLLEEDTFSHWACRIGARLSEKAPNTLQLVVLSDKLRSADLASLIPFGLKTLASLTGSLKKIYGHPAWIFECLVIVIWKLPKVFDLEALSDFDADAFAHPPPLVPISLQPSKVEAQKSTATPMYWGINIYSTGNMDPICSPDVVYLSWQRYVRMYVSDFTVYVSEPHKKPPKSEYASIWYMPLTSEYEQARLMIRFRSCISTEQFISQREQYKRPNQHDGEEPSALGGWSPEQEVLSCILCVFAVMRWDVYVFINACHREIHSVRMAIRQSPSSSKMKYLLHLEDVIKRNLQGLDHSMIVLQTLATWKELDPEEKKRMDEMETDLKYLKVQLQTLMANVQTDQEFLRKRFQVVQDLRLFRLTILAGVFLPLSFATSFFGMNIETNTEEGFAGFSNWTKSLLQDLSPDVHNSTAVVTSAVATSGSLNFTPLTVGVTAACLLLTLPISLAIGAILRAIIGGVAVSAVYWRSFLAIAAIFCMVVSIAGQYIFSGFYRGDIAWMLINGILLLFEVFMAFLAWRRKNKRHLIFWVVIFILSAVCFALSIYFGDFYLVTFMVVPWGLCFGYLAVVQRRRQLIPKRQKSAANEGL